MRRILLIVAMLLIATPVFATVTVNAVPKTLTDGTYVVEVNYATTGEIVRAFALNISVTNGADINTIYNYQIGDNNGYGIFPGKFRDVINAAAPDWQVAGYNPVAPVADRDALTGLGTAGITVEMGSLYAATAPGTSGKLFDVNVPGHGAVSSVLTLATNATRGGIVLEDGSAAVSPVLNGTTLQYIFPPPAPAYIKYANYDPDCNVPIWWAKVAEATDYNLERSSKAAPAYVEIKNGLADFNCFAADCNWGDLKLAPDTNYHWRVRAHNAAGYSAYTTQNYDCNAINSLCYPTTGTTQGSYAVWRTMGKPDCWCAFKGAGLGPRGRGYQCDGDAAGDDSGPTDYFRVYGSDLTMVTTHWRKTRPMITADPNATGSGTFRQMAACADIDHADSGPTDYFKVYGTDLSRVINNWKKHNSSWSGTDKLPGNCPH